MELDIYIETTYGHCLHGIPWMHARQPHNLTVHAHRRQSSSLRKGTHRRGGVLHWNLPKFKWYLSSAMQHSHPCCMHVSMYIRAARIYLYCTCIAVNTCICTACLRKEDDVKIRDRLRNWSVFNWHTLCSFVYEGDTRRRNIQFTAASELAKRSAVIYQRFVYDQL